MEMISFSLLFPGYTQNEASLFIFFIPGVTPDTPYGPDPFQAYINACRSLGSFKVCESIAKSKILIF